uniref:Pyridoxal phosphatase n=1 Tax=Strigops habroptila TaxID=2489341 RepID=A0A672TQH7_STRHB
MANCRRLSGRGAAGGAGPGAGAALRLRRACCGRASGRAPAPPSCWSGCGAVARPPSSSATTAAAPWPSWSGASAASASRLRPRPSTSSAPRSAPRSSSAKRLLGGGGVGSGDSGGRVFVLGGEGLRGEVRDAGLRLAGEGESAPAEPVRAVLVGYDDQFTFAKLAEACGYLRDPQCLLVATDPEPLAPAQRRAAHPRDWQPHRPQWKLLQAARRWWWGNQTRTLFDCIVERFGVDPSRTLMVGDRLETDILFGKNCGLSTILTLTGVSRLEEAQAYMASDSAAAKDMVPNYYVDSIADLTTRSGE